MEEIKAPLHKRICNFIWDHIALIGIIFLFAVVLFSSCGTAKAESFEYKEEDYFNSCLEYFVELYGGDETLLNTLKANLNYNMDFTFLEKDAVTFPSGNIKYCVIFTDSNSSVCYPLSRSRSSSFSTGLTTNNATVWVDAPYTAEYVPCNMYYLIQNTGNQISFYKTYYYGNAGGSTASWATNRTNTTYYGSSGFILDNVQFCLSYNHYNYGADRQYELNGLPEYDLTAYSTDITELIPFRTYVTDSRLRIYKTSTTYGDTLNIDISRFIEDFPIEIPHQGDARLVPKEITLTINSNNTDYTYVVDPSTGLWENNSTLAQVPYQWFLDADIPLQNAVITQCSFTLQASNDTQQTVSYDYYIACSYNISNQSDIIVPDIVPNPTYNNTEIIDNTTMTNIVNNLNNVSSQYNDNTGSWVYLQSLPTFPSWAAVDGINAFTPDNGLKFYTYEGSIIYKYVDDDYAINFGNYVYDNATSMYYDVIYFRVTSADFPAITTNNTPPDSTTFLGYLVFYSQRYYLRYDVYNQLSLIEAIQAEAENAKTFYTTVKTVLDNFDTQTIEAFNNLIGIGNTANGWFATLDNSLSTGVNKIVTAIENIDGFSFDDSGIIAKLDTIISNQNSTKDGYALYIAWVKDSVNNSGLHTWANGVIDSLKKAFTFLVPTDLDSEIEGDQTYIWYTNKFFDFVFGDERLTTYLQNNTINIYSYTGGYTYE